MDELKSLFDIFGHDDTKKEIYLSDQKKRYWRSQKGVYSRTKGLFNFLQLIKSWEDIVGEMMAKNTIPLKIKNKTLYINTKHAIFSQELGFLAPEILQKIKKKFPELTDKVQYIKFSHSNLSARSFTQEQKRSSHNDVQRPKKPSLHPQSPAYKTRLNMAKEMFAHIEDEDIQKRLIDFMLGH